MASTITQIIAEIQDIISEVDGIVSTPTIPPTEALGLSLPASIVIPSEAEWEPYPSRGVRSERTFAIFVLIESQRNSTNEARYEDAFSMLQDIGDKFANSDENNQRLRGTVDQIRGLRDTGLDGSLMYAGAPFFGFVFYMDVVVKGG